MSGAKEHYDTHLAGFYSWMAGDFEKQVGAFIRFLTQAGIKGEAGELAIDLGAGHGIQSLALAKSGFKVKAIDFNKTLLNELIENTRGFEVEPVLDDIRNMDLHVSVRPWLVSCCGDTLTHLSSLDELKCLMNVIYQSLLPNGKLLLSFRDYSSELNGVQRFIPVKSDENRIHTCFLEYTPTHVQVTDLLHEREGRGWKQNLSSYSKLRLAPGLVEHFLKAQGMQLLYNEPWKGLFTIVAQKEI